MQVGPGSLGMENCSEKEKEKLWEFSTEKSKWLGIPNRNKVEEIEVKLRKHLHINLWVTW